MLSTPPPQTQLADTLVRRQGDNWNDLLKQVITFNSVEEFWGIYVSLNPIILTPFPALPVQS